MLAGGWGNIRREHIQKDHINPGAKLIVLGGPAMDIGLGGGAASSMNSGQSSEELDFASVQRGNPEMQRRCQEVIDSCWQLGADNPIMFIHDVGAGGLSNAMPELVSDGGVGGRFELRAIPNDEPGMSPLQIWCNESQERYVLAVDPDKFPVFEAFCKRERAQFAVIGVATEERRVVLHDEHFDNCPIDLPLDILLGKPPRMFKKVEHAQHNSPEFDATGICPCEAAERVLALPAVAEKTFLITIGDRSVTGLVARDQMVGPWQVPVADVAVTAASYDSYNGEACAVGERTPVALLDHKASVRLAVGEALTNLAAAYIGELNRVKLSANWMAANGHPGEDAGLFDAVKTLGMEICPELGITVPVGKDSMSMKTSWEEDGVKRDVIAPMSLIITSFARAEDVRKTLTPQLKTDKGDTDLIYIDLGERKGRLGASALSQVYRQLGNKPADLENASRLKGLFDAIQFLNKSDLILAYHDISDGGLFTAVAEMAFAGHTGVSVTLDQLNQDNLAAASLKSLVLLSRLSVRTRRRFLTSSLVTVWLTSASLLVPYVMTTVSSSLVTVRMLLTTPVLTTVPFGAPLLITCSLCVITQFALTKSLKTRLTRRIQAYSSTLPSITKKTLQLHSSTRALLQRLLSYVSRALTPKLKWHTLSTVLALTQLTFTCPRS